MSAPLTRDQQIDFMKNAQQRQKARIEALMSHREVREAFLRPAPGQEDEMEYTSEYKRVARRA